MQASSEDDRLLIDRYLVGDPAAVRTVDGWIEVVLREGFRALREDWDDLKQEIRARVLRNLTRGVFHGRSTLRTYVHRISKNVAIDFSRQAYRRREVRVNPDEPRFPTAASEPGGLTVWLARDLLEKILIGLTEEDRTLLQLVFGMHYSYEEVAAELGIPEGTVKSRMSRCKDRILKLRRHLAAKEG